MDSLEATKVIDNFKSALSQLQSDASMYKHCKIRNVKLEKDTIELNKTITELKHFKYHFNKLAAASNVAICGQCDGRGGFDYDDGHGGGGSEQCLACDGSGVVDKSTLPLIEKEVTQNTNDKPPF
jgi:DnaJ-class molecular chaperone